MNRRNFLKTLGMIPALSMLPNLLLAEEVPEFLELELKLNSFGGKVPKLIFKTKEWTGPAYIAYIDPVVEHIEKVPAGHMSTKYPSGFFVHYTYTQKVKIVNTAKFRQSEIKTVAVNNSLWITT